MAKHIAEGWPITTFDPGWEAFSIDPYPFYDRLRSESPVHQIPSTGEYWVTRYRDVDLVLKDPRFSVEHNFDPGGLGILGRSMVFRDPPDHTRLRGLVNKAFTPRTVEQVRDRITLSVERLLDDLRGRERIDVVDDFAYILPMMVFSELLGLPQKDTFKIGNLLLRRIVSTDPYKPPSAEVQADAAVVYREVVAYVMEKVKERRVHRQDDLISAMIAAEEDNQRLTDEEVLAMVYLLIGAGHEPAATGISSGVLHLLQNPSQLELLRRQPELMPQAVEELLRYDSPAQRRVRRCVEDVRIGDTLLPRDAKVTAVIGAANRDPEVFPEPNRLDVTRPLHANKSLAFGSGFHFCLGAFLARLEIQIALSGLLALPGLDLVDGDPPVWTAVSHFHRLSRLPVLVKWS